MNCAMSLEISAGPSIKKRIFRQIFPISWHKKQRKNLPKSEKMITIVMVKIFLEHIFREVRTNLSGSPKNMSGNPKNLSEKSNKSFGRSEKSVGKIRQICREIRKKVFSKGSRVGFDDLVSYQTSLVLVSVTLSTFEIIRY